MAGTDLTVQLRIIADASQLQNTLRGLTGGLGGVSAAGQGAFNGMNASSNTFRTNLRDMIGKFTALWTIFKGAQAVGRAGMFGIDFNAEMENARLGIATLITAQAKVLDSTGKELNARESLNAAYALSEDQVKKLRIAGLETAATTEQLVGAFQDAVGGGLRAGMSLDQIRVLTVQTVQAAGAMHVPMNQLNQEIRSILDGTIDRNSRVAVRLGITNAMVKDWTNAGTLFENLNKKMMSFSLAGKDAMGTWTVTLSNVVEASQIVMGEITKVPFDELKRSLQGVMGAFIDTGSAQISGQIANVVQMGKDIAGWVTGGVVAVIEGVMGMVRSMADYWVANRENLTRFLAELGSMVRLISGGVLGILGGLVKILASIAGFLTAMPAWFRAGGVAIVLFTASMMKIVSVAYGGLVPGLMAIATNLFNVARGATTASSAMGSFSAVMGKGGWIGIAVAAVTALTLAFTYLSGEAKRAREEVARGVGTEVDRIVAIKNASEAYAASVKELGEYDKRSPENKQLSDREALLNRAKSLYDALITLDRSYVGPLSAAKLDSGKVYDVLVRKAAMHKEALKAQQGVLREKLRGAGEDTTPNATWTEAATKFLPFGTSTKDRIAAATAEYAKLQAQMSAISVLMSEMDPKKEQAQIKPNPRLPSDTEKKQAEDAKNDLAQARLTAESLEVGALERKSLAQQEILALKKEERQVAAAIASIEARKVFGVFTQDEKDKAKQDALAAGEQAMARIREEFREKDLDAERAYQDGNDRNSKDTLARRIEAIEQAEEKVVRVHSRLKGLELTEAQIHAEAVARVEQRVADETARFRENELEKLRGGLRKAEDQLGDTFTLEEQIAWLAKFGTGLGVSSQAVARLTQDLHAQAVRRDDWFAGWKQGFKDWVTNASQYAKRFSHMVAQMMDGTVASVSAGLSSIFEKGKTGSEKWSAIWQSLSGTVMKALLDMAATELVLWGVQAGRAALEESGWIKKKAAVVAEVGGEATKAAAIVSGQAAIGTAYVAANAVIIPAAVARGIATAALIGTMASFAAAETWAAYALMPFIGEGLAMAQIEIMTASIAAANLQATAAGAIPGAANGAWFGKPTLAMIGEGPRPEIVVPDTSFKDFAGGLAQRILSQERQQQGYRSQGARNARNAQGKTGKAISFDGATVFTSSSREMQDFVSRALYGNQQRKS